MKQPWIKKWGEGEPLDGGGQGATFLVSDSNNLQGVLKLLNKKSDLKARRRMHREVSNLIALRLAEAKVPQILDHNIIGQSEIEDLETELFFVMEYMQGDTLAKLVKAKGSLSLEQSVNVCLALCSTLRLVNQENIVHRDLKQENVIIRNLDTYDVVMVDFGISFHKEANANLTDHEETFQNSLIRLPERTGIGENKRNFCSDLTDVCAILFFCLTGQPPRNLRDSNNNPPHKAFQQQLASKITDPIQLNFLNAFFEKGFQTDISLRFQSVDQIETRLKEILNPPGSEFVEPLSSIFASSRDKLRKDPKTQAEEYQKYIRMKLESGYGDFESLDKIIGELCQYSHPYFINQARETVAWNGILADGSVYVTKIRVANQTHNIEIFIEYKFILENGECAVRRVIKGKREKTEIAQVDLLINTVAPDRIIDLVPEQAVARYGEPSNFPIIEMKKDVESAIGKCIKIIERRILKE